MFHFRSVCTVRIVPYHTVKKGAAGSNPQAHFSVAVLQILCVLADIQGVSKRALQHGFFLMGIR